MSAAVLYFVSSDLSISNEQRIVSFWGFRLCRTGKRGFMPVIFVVFFS